MRKRRVLQVGVPFIMLIAVVAVPSAILADHSAGPGSLSVLSIQEDQFYNWDFVSNDDFSSSNVDWPVNMLFYNNAEVDKVKGIYWGNCHWPVASAKYARLNDGSGMVWDNDSGTKSPCDCTIWGNQPHMRVYADDNDTLYNTSWGFYVLGTTHTDHNECGLNPWHGESEDTEGLIADRASDRGYTVFEDWGNFYNAESWRREGNHIVENDGYATAVYVP